MRFTVRIPGEAGRSRKPLEQLPGGAGHVTPDTGHLQPPVPLDSASAGGRHLLLAPSQRSASAVVAGYALPLPPLRAARSSLRFFPSRGPRSPPVAGWTGLSHSSLGTCPFLRHLLTQTDPRAGLRSWERGFAWLASPGQLGHGDPCGAQLWQRRLSLATGRPMYGCRWGGRQFPAQRAVAREADSGVQRMSPCAERCPGGAGPAASPID